jgi:CheY-like chemotaxis protein
MFAFIFIDCNMPLMNGFELVSILRQKRLEHNVDVVFVSCSALEYSMAMMKSKGFDFGIQKPVTIESLKDLFLYYKRPYI